MKNLLILYNPYYNQEMIEDHIRILSDVNEPVEAKVGFGKIRSKIRNYEHSKEEIIETLYEGVSSDAPLQLFLTDFSSMYVCRVESILESLEGIDYPNYYDALDVERWFVVTDIRELARHDFEYVRDKLLVGFTTPNYGNHTYALYGNRYDYPLEVKQKEPVDYFESYDEGERHFQKVFKSAAYAQVRQTLTDYVFGKEILYAMHPDSVESLIEAEVQYMAHKENATYDFSAVVINYAKVFENESYYTLRVLFEILMGHDAKLEALSYSVQGHRYQLIDYLRHKPNMGTNKHLLSHPKIYGTIKSMYGDYKKYGVLLNLLTFKLKNAITTVQEIRNEASHGGSISKTACETLRALLLGVGEESILSELYSVKRRLLETDR